MIYYKYTTKSKKILKPYYAFITLYSINNFIQEMKALIKRLYIQLHRRPSNIFASIIQSLLWLILFGALFQNAPINSIGQYNIKYFHFLSYGLIIFTAFTSSINAGLPIIFDREFGFFNRLLISPLMYKNTLFYSLLIYTLSISFIQVICVFIASIYFSKLIFKINNIITIIKIIFLIIFNIANISITLSLILPGHVEFLAFTLLINLPTLFASTALAPLYFMPYWLQILTCFNPLTYAIEIIRFLCLETRYTLNTKLIETNWLNLTITESFIILITITILSFITTHKVLQYKYN
uniref:ABC transmembrane type-2 domain-containing protein n=1 Tax=Caloglossa beccarii TaxID=131038 RepID=A0A1Z1M8Q1_9FLOR|nr:hypothetical protein [Caloglossa beccarii]ARW62349.1 hypothetical protein [Caloglossa beccarii]